MTRWKKIIGIFIAMNGVGCGVAIFLQTGLGGDPIGILCEGISRLLNIEFGHASLLYNVLLIGLAAVAASKNIGTGSIVYAALSGYFIDFYSRSLSVFELQHTLLPVKLSVYGAGILLFTMSLAILIYFELGMNALDALLWKVSERYQVSYVTVRLITDLSFVGIGYLAGGTFGIGTAVCFLTTGTLIKKFTGLFAAWQVKCQSNKEVAKA